MRKVTVLVFLLPLMLVNILGCVPLIVGGAVGALGGYAISKDTVQGETDKPYESLWDSALMVSRGRGTIKQEDSLKGYLELEVNQGRVLIRLIRLTQATTRIRISARNKYRFPDRDLAEELFVKIIEGAR